MAHDDHKNTEVFSTEKKLTFAFLSIGLITNFLSLNEIFLISDHGKPTFGVRRSTFSYILSPSASTPR